MRKENMNIFIFNEIYPFIIMSDISADIINPFYIFDIKRFKDVGGIFEFEFIELFPNSGEMHQNCRALGNGIFQCSCYASCFFDNLFDVFDFFENEINFLAVFPIPVRSAKSTLTPSALLSSVCI